MEDHTQLLVRTSQLYYEDGLNQNEIADILNVSRPTVSRLLEEAKREGVVEIIVHDPIRKNSELSNRLRKALNLKDAIVISGSYEYEKSLDRCCEATIQLLATIIKNGQTLGITWGSVPHRIADLLDSAEYYNLNVVQMVGCLGTGNPDVDGLELAIQLSKKLGGTYSNIYAPIYVESEEVRNYLVREPQIASTLKKAMNTDLIFMGIGSMESCTTIQRAGYWTDATREKFIANGAVGHLLGRIFDINGNPVEQPNCYIVGAPLEACRNAADSIGVAVSAGRALATIGAARGGYISTLVADEELALAVLDYLKE